MKIEKLFETQISEAQFEFYRKNKAGCLFAAVAAKKPAQFGWLQKIISPHSEIIDKTIQRAITNRNVTMLSLIFPQTNSPDKLSELVKTLCSCQTVLLEQNILFEDSNCLGFRVKVGGLTSWASGFGPFEFLPITRQSPFTEITFRVKPRPNFKWVMKESPKNVIHLADLDMLGMADAMFRTVWKATLNRTAKLLGHQPNLKSAAKTTFSIPKELWLQTCLLNANENNHLKQSNELSSLPLGL